MKKYLFYLIPLVALVIVLSCTEEEASLEPDSFSTDLKLETRENCEGCGVVLTQNGCAIEYTIIGECGEIESVVWTYPGGTNNPNPGFISANPNITGVYEITITFTNGCVVTDDITIQEGCDELCTSCEVQIEVDDDNCYLVAIPSDGCDQPVEYSWITSSGSNNDASYDFTSAGIYCVTITDAKGCRTRSCITVEACDPCEDCTVRIENDISDCTVSAFVEGSCIEPLSYTWYVDGKYIDFYQAEYQFGGTYCVDVTDARGCTVRECILTEPCECNPEWESRSFNPQVFLRPSNLECIIQLRNRIRYGYSCNDCCEDVSPRELQFTISSTTVNQLGEVLLEEEREFTRTECSGTRGLFIENLNCDDVAVGDVLTMSWTVEITASSGCEFAGDTFLQGTDVHVVTAHDLIDCCEE